MRSDKHIPDLGQTGLSDIHLKRCNGASKGRNPWRRFFIPQNEEEMFLCSCREQPTQAWVGISLRETRRNYYDRRNLKRFKRRSIRCLIRNGGNRLYKSKECRQYPDEEPDGLLYRYRCFHSDRLQPSARRRHGRYHRKTRI